MNKKTTMGKSVVLMLLLCVTTLMFFSPSVKAQEWRTEIVDTGWPYDYRVGLFTSIALDSNGYPHISYHDDDVDALKYARWDGAEWNIETVDSQDGVDVGEWTSIALDSGDNPHISYKYTVSYYEAYLRYARWNRMTEEWIIETVPSPPTIDYNVGSYSSIALDSSGYPHISYHGLSGPPNFDGSDDLMYAWRDGSGWHTETVPDPSERVGWFTSLALDSSGNPHISYYDVTETDLKHAWYDGSDWHIENPDMNGEWGMVGFWTSIALDSGDNPHISYWGDITEMIWTGHFLKHAWWDEDWGEWREEAIWDGVNTDCYTSIALDSGDNIHIAYHDDYRLKYVYGELDDGYWFWHPYEIVDDAGQYCCIALDSAGYPHISYYLLMALEGLHYLGYATTAPTLTLDGANSWYWTSDTRIRSVAVGDVDEDGNVEMVTGGYHHDGTRFNAQLAVWDGATLSLEGVTTWYWAHDTSITSVAVGDVDGDGDVEIVTGGFYHDGTRYVAQLCVWSGALSLESVVTWYWTSHTDIWSVAVGDVDGDGEIEIITGGNYWDFSRYVAQLCVWDGATLALEGVRTWHWGDDTYILSVAVGDVDGDMAVEIVTGGHYYDGTRLRAQLAVWDASTLALEDVKAWHWVSSTYIFSVTCADVDGDNYIEIVTGGNYWDGTLRWAQLCVWDGSTMNLEGVKTWYSTSHTRIDSVACANVDGDAQVEIVTGGYYYDGTRLRAQLAVWDGATLALEDMTTWHWVSYTYLLSVAIGDVDGDGQTEIVTGGYYDDGMRDRAQLCVWGFT